MNIQYGIPIHPAPRKIENPKCGNSSPAEAVREGHRRLTVPLCRAASDVTVIDSRCGNERNSTVLLPTARSTRSNQSKLRIHITTAATAISDDTMVASWKVRDILGVVTGRGSPVGRRI